MRFLVWTLLLVVAFACTPTHAQILNATACRIANCSNNGNCLPDFSCICDLAGSWYGPSCNQTALQCGLARCSGRGVCVAASQTQCLCGLAHYDGSMACSSCIKGFNLTSNCTTCANGYFGDQCTMTATQCGSVLCAGHGICLGAGNSTGCQCFSSTLYLNQANCTQDTCGAYGAPDPATNFSTCACSQYFLDNATLVPRCQIACQNGGTPFANGTGCFCASDFYGIACQNAPILCGPRGYRTSPTTCGCTDFYSGATCDIPPPDCGAHGTVVSPTLCNCTDYYTGLLCTQPPIPCVHGSLISPSTCVCTGFYTGLSCTIPPIDCFQGTFLNATYCQCNQTLITGPSCNISMVDCGSYCTRINATACARNDPFTSLDCFTPPPVLNTPTSSGLSATDTAIIVAVSVTGTIVVVWFVLRIFKECGCMHRWRGFRLMKRVSTKPASKAAKRKSKSK